MKSKKEREEIESFAHVLTELQASLKPWIPRFQEAVSSPSLGSDNLPEQLFSSRTVDAEKDDMGKVANSPDPTNLNSLVSPSPLVSWRAGCFNEDGRQLFLLTPLPKLKTFSSKLQGSSKSAFETLRTNTNVRPPQSHFVSPGDMNNILLEGIVAERTPVKLSDPNVNNVDTMEFGFISPEKFSKMDCSMVAMTPCLEVSPPKSCVLLEPISEFTRKKNCVVRVATPFPTGVHNFSSYDDSDSSSSEASEHLILKYPELVGIKQACELGNGRKVVEASPNWFMSPPKTCILMEPPDENLLTSSATNWQWPRTAHAPCWKEKKETEFQSVPTVTKKSCYQGLGDSLTVVERTPVWKEPESTARTGKRPGENTLKKELWTKFEAATTHGLRFNVFAPQETANANKEFLDLLEEVS